MYRRFLSVRYFRTRLVNWLSVVGVMVGVAVMIVVWSVFTGFATETRKAIRGTLADVELRPDGDTVPPLYPELERLLLACPDVAAAAPRLVTPLAHPYTTALSTQGAGEAFHLMEAIGVDWAREVAFVDRARQRGVRDLTGLPTLVLAQEDPRDPFYSTTATAKWGDDPTVLKAMFSLTFLRHFVGPSDAKAPAFLGRTVDIALGRTGVDADGNPDYRRANFKIYVASVYDGREQESDLRRFYIDRATLWRISKPLPPPGAPRVGDDPPEKVPYASVAIAITDYERADGFRERIVAWCRDHGVRGLDAYTWQDQRSSILKAVANEKMLLAIVIGFIGLLAGFTILATLTLTVIEKTRDIGVLLALGATARGVLAVFLGNGLLIGVLGGLLGMLLGIGLTRALNPINVFLRDRMGVDLFPPEVYGFEQIPYLFDVHAMLWIAGGCMAVAFFASLLPALRAARLDPVVALRHE